MTVTEPIDRTAARVLLIDARRRVLLFHAADPGCPGPAVYWFTVGGGLDPGESAVEGALRETYEETGLRLSAADLAGPVWHEVAEFPFDGRAYRQSQHFFVSRVDTCEVDTSAFGEDEVRSIDEHRWWSVEELEATAETYYPRELPVLLRRVLAEVGR